MKKLLPERRREKPQIILTNLIDVILLLVFFFMITSTFAKDRNKIPIELPRASTAASADGEVLTIQLSADGRTLVGGEPVPQSELGKRVAAYVSDSRDRPIMLEADGTLAYTRIIENLDIIRTNGGVNIGLATRPQAARR